MLKIAIVDDDNACLEQEAAYTARYAKEKQLQIETSIFHSGMELMKQLSNRFDIIFLDIEMDGMDGMETAREIRKAGSDAVIVFITNMAQYALDYVLKPVTYYSFSVRMDRAVLRVDKREPKELLLNLQDGVRRLRTDEIHYVEVQNRLLQYHTEHGIFQVRGTLQAAEAQLKSEHFVRCNHWYLVNLKYVSEIRKNLVVVAGDELEISRRNKTAFLSALTDYMGMGL